VKIQSYRQHRGHLLSAPTTISSPSTAESGPPSSCNLTPNFLAVVSGRLTPAEANQISAATGKVLKDIQAELESRAPVVKAEADPLPSKSSGSVSP